MRVLSAMQPSGQLHLGNYLGSMKPNLEMATDAEESLFFIVDLHALTTVHDPKLLCQARKDAAFDYLAAGLDPSKTILFYQSSVQEHTELMWILSTITPVGMMERAVSYKDKVQRGLDANVGLLAYPVLMAADILLYDIDIVPVGKDQKQHVEMTRDIALKFNNAYGETLHIPEPLIREDSAVVPGIDGQKMSKSYGNTIPLFADEKVIEKAIMSIVTDSKTVEEKKDPGKCVLYQIHALLLDDQGKKELAGKYRAGGLGYGEAKKNLLADYMEYFAPMREKRAKLTDKEVENVINDGAEKARAIAGKTMGRVRKAVGLL